MNYARFNHRIECLYIINTLLLMEAFCNKPILITFNALIFMLFEPDRPICFQQTCDLVVVELSPKYHLNKGIELNMHCIIPIRIFRSFRETARFSKNRIHLSKKYPWKVYLTCPTCGVFGLRLSVWNLVVMCWKGVVMSSNLGTTISNH